MNRIAQIARAVVLALLMSPHSQAGLGGIDDAAMEEFRKLETSVQERNKEQALEQAELLLMAGTFAVSFEFEEKVKSNQRKDAEKAFWEAAKTWSETLDAMQTGAELAPRFLPASAAPATRGRLKVILQEKLDYKGYPAVGLWVPNGWNIELRVRTTYVGQYLRTQYFGKKQFLNTLVHELGHGLKLDHFGDNQGHAMGGLVLGREVSAPSASEKSVLKKFRDDVIALRAQALEL